LNDQDNVDFASPFDEDFDFSVKILNMLQLAFSDLVEKLYQREDALNYLISELSLGKPEANDALNTSFEQNQPIASSSMLQQGKNLLKNSFKNLIRCICRRGS
jgi:competence CoiA-like predicted nuclease